MSQITQQGTEKHLQIRNKIDKCFSVGAEAIISLDKNSNKIIKNRIKKSYRIKEIDERLRKTRTKSEAKIINKLQNTISVPKIIKSDDKQEIIMEYIDGKKLSDNLESLDFKEICRIIGEEIAKIHNNGIIHGDLTTSNMIYVEDNEENNNLINESDISLNQSTPQHLNFNINKIKKESIESINNKVYFIDFGLAFHSQKIEDKAVDLHLLQQALEAKHFTIWKECIKIIFQNYEKTANQGKEIIHRIKIIESRGRYKDKY